MISFWCKNCRLDMDLDCEKQSNSYGEWFMARCGKCDSKLLRYITEKHKDPYFQESKRVRIQREKYAKDLIQPGQNGFKIFYRKEWEKLEKAKEEHEKKQLMKKQERDKFYAGFKGSGYQDIVKKVVEREAAM